jgi:glycosyltransferase involved in cell wall biosynthesis
MIHVCHIISGDLWAGAEVMDYCLLKNLKRYKDLGLSAILLNEGRLADEIRRLGIPVDVVDETRRSFIQLIRDTRRILDWRSPRIVHSHRYKENILAFLSSKNKNSIHLVSTQHGMPESIGANRNPKYMLLHKLNISLFMKSFKRVIAVSGDIQDILINKYGFPGNKITVIHNGTDIPEESPIKRERDIFIIGSMGRMFPVKDYPLMVEIAREVYRETDKIRFELAGDGPDMARVTDLLERYRLGDIFVLRGFVEDLTGFYQGLDIYLNTSLHEGIPMSVLEAMSHGIPVIAPNVGGLKEMIKDGNEGYLVDGRDPKAFARKCLRLYGDRLLRQSMGSSARKKVEKEFTNDGMAREYYRLYLDVACGPRRGVRA